MSWLKKEFLLLRITKWMKERIVTSQMKKDLKNLTRLHKNILGKMKSIRINLL